MISENNILSQNFEKETKNLENEIKKQHSTAIQKASNNLGSFWFQTDAFFGRFLKLTIEVLL